MIDLRNSITRKEVPENKNPKKVVNVVEKILTLIKKQIGKGGALDLAKGIEILTAKEILQRLPIALAQVKEGNTSENLLNEIRQLIYFLYREKEITKKVYDNIMSSIKLWNRMDTIFMNSQNSKNLFLTLLKLSDKIDLKRGDKYVALSILAFTIHGKI